MSGVGYDQLHRVFTEACRLDGAEREAFLDEACGGDDTLRDAVRAMLAADARESRPFAGADSGGGAHLLARELAEVGDLAPVAAPVPERVGRYRIVREDLVLALSAPRRDRA